MKFAEIKALINKNPDAIDWESLSQYKALENQASFMMQNAEKLDWNTISQFQILNSSNIMDNVDKINWNKVYRYQKLDLVWLDRLDKKYKELIDWDTISETQVLNEGFISRYRDKLNWHKICKYQNLSESFMEFNITYLDMKEISRSQTLSETFIETHKDDLYWPYICKHQDLSEAFINQHLDKIDWQTLDIGVTSQLTDTFVLNHKDDIGLDRVFTEHRFSISTLISYVDQYPTVIFNHDHLICRYQRLNENFITLHNDYIRTKHNNQWIDWHGISYYQSLSESFINNHKGEVHWPSISIKQLLGTNFIRTNRNLVDWKFIIMYQNHLSESFFLEFIDKELQKDFMGLMSRYVQLSESTMNTYFNYIGWDNIARYQILSNGYYNTHKENLKRPKWVNICYDIEPTMRDDMYIDDLLSDFDYKEFIDYNEFVRWHYTNLRMLKLNEFWELYDNYMRSKVYADRLTKDDANDIKRYRHLDWLM